MRDRLAVFMCNLKASKMRGVFSEGMIMCAKDGKVEILEPPPGVVPGDRVTCEGYTGKLQVLHYQLLHPLACMHTIADYYGHRN